MKKAFLFLPIIALFASITLAGCNNDSSVESSNTLPLISFPDESEVIDVSLAKERVKDIEERLKTFHISVINSEATYSYNKTDIIAGRKITSSRFVSYNKVDGYLYQKNEDMKEDGSKTTTEEWTYFDESAGVKVKASLTDLAQKVDKSSMIKKEFITELSSTLVDICRNWTKQGISVINNMFNDVDFGADVDLKDGYQREYAFLSKSPGHIKGFLSGENVKPEAKVNDSNDEETSEKLDIIRKVDSVAEIDNYNLKSISTNEVKAIQGQENLTQIVNVKVSGESHFEKPEFVK